MQKARQVSDRVGFRLAAREAEKDRLKHVFGVGKTARDAIRGAEDPPLMLEEETFELQWMLGRVRGREFGGQDELLPDWLVTIETMEEPPALTGVE